MSWHAHLYRTSIPHLCRRTKAIVSLVADAGVMAPCNASGAMALDANWQGFGLVELKHASSAGFATQTLTCKVICQVFNERQWT